MNIEKHNRTEHGVAKTTTTWFYVIVVSIKLTLIVAIWNEHRHLKNGNVTIDDNVQEVFIVI